MDIRLNYIEKGKGKPLILLHGNGEDSSMFHEQTDELSEFFHVFALDTRGHGKSSRGEMPFTIRQFSDDLNSFMDEHQIARAHILGFSDGGNIAMVFAIMHPERVDSLIVNGANLDSSGVRAKTQIPIEIEYRIARCFSRISDSAKRRSEMLGLMVKDPALKPEELSAIKARTLVIAGTDDMIKESHTRLIAESIPQSELVFLDGDHFIAYRRPKEFNRAVLDFLSRSV